MLSKIIVRSNSRAFTTSAIAPALFTSVPATRIESVKENVLVASQLGGGDLATVGVWVGYGSRFETAQQNGSSQLLEHLSFNATTKRAAPQLKAEIASLGGHVHARTNRDHSVYYATVQKKDVTRAVDLLTDMMLNPLINDATLAAAKASLMCPDRGSRLSRDVVLDHLHETAFQGSALGRLTLGPLDSVQAISKGDLQAFAAQRTSRRVVVAGSGDIDQDRFQEVAAKSLSVVPSNGSKDEVVPAVFRGSDKRIRFDSHHIARVGLAFARPGYDSSAHFTFKLLEVLLGSWSRNGHIGRNSSFRLGQSLNETDEMVRNYTAFNVSYEDTGLFGVYLEAYETKLEDAMYYTLDNLVRLGYTLTDDELERAKNVLKTNILVQRNSSEGNFLSFVKHVSAYGREMSLAETFTRIEHLTLTDVRRVANSFINDEDHALAAIGSIYELPDYNWIRRRSYWHRF